MEYQIACIIYPLWYSMKHLKAGQQAGILWISHTNEAIKWTFQSQMFPPSLYSLLICTSPQRCFCMCFLLTNRCTHKADLNKLMRGTSPAHHSRGAVSPWMHFSSRLESPPSVLPRCVGFLYIPSQGRKWEDGSDHAKER